MAWIDLLLAVLFMVIGSGCTVIVLIGLPGTWLMIALAFGLSLTQRLWAPSGSEWLVPWWVFLIGIVIAIIGEVLEFMAGALGAKKGGASKQGMLGALIGGFAGTLIGTFVIPIPIVGSLIGAIIGCGIGAIIGELKAAPTPSSRTRSSLLRGRWSDGYSGHSQSCPAHWWSGYC